MGVGFGKKAITSMGMSGRTSSFMYHGYFTTYGTDGLSKFINTISHERCDVEFADRDCTAEAWANRWGRLDARIVAFGLEANLTVDYHTHAVEPDLPRYFMPFVGGKEAFVRKTMLLRGCRVMHAELADRVFPVEDQFAPVVVHPQVGRVRLADDAEGERRAANERGHGGGHDPIHGRAGDLDPVTGPCYHTALVRY